MTKRNLIIALCILCGNILSAQSLLKNTVSIKANNQALHDVLTILSNEANITFSYNTKTIPRDSLVTINVLNKPLGEVLRSLFKSGYEFKESGTYVIIRRKAISTSAIVAKSRSVTDYYNISGKIIDDETGERVSEASIYERQHLISSLADEQGNFSLRLKNKYPTASITVSKENYYDTTIEVQSKINQVITIALSKKEMIPTIAINNIGPQQEVPNDVGQINKLEEGFEAVEKKWISRVLLSSKQRIRSLNLKKFYTTRAYQISFVPGISTHGKMNSQVISKTSINLLGGYSGGVDAFEVGVVFNIVKKNVNGVQLAGVFNIVGGEVKAVQVASVFNEVEGNTKGVQISGLVNVVKKEMEGIQIATLYNKAKNVKGMQIGFVNVTEGNEGTSIGLINISKGKGNRKRVGFLVRLPRKNRLS